MKQSIGSGRGSVYNIIMKALQSGDKYGYQICQEVEEKTNGNYILKQPSLYSGLKRLEAQKYVESYWGDSDIGGRRHYYKLTEAGRKKIESTDFSWEDERNEIVDNFFKKSYIDENLDDVKNSLSDVSEQVKQIQDNNSSLDSVLNNDNSNSSNISNETISLTNDKINTEQLSKNSFAHTVNENQFDLFSFVQTNEKVNEVEQESNQLVENNIIEPSINNQVETTEESVNLQSEQKEIVEEPKIDFDQFFNFKPKASFSENVEERTNNIDTLISTPKQDDFAQRYANFQKDINQSNVILESENKSIQETTIGNNNQNEVVNQANLQNDAELQEKIRLEQERRMSEALSGGINSHYLSTEKEDQTQTFGQKSTENLQAINQPHNPPKNENILSSDEYNLSQENMRNSDELSSENTILKDEDTINLRSIFGDVLDESESKASNLEEQNQNYNDYNETNFGIENLSKTSPLNNENSFENVITEDSPNSNAVNNINISLQVEGDNSSRSNSYDNFYGNNYYNYEQNNNTYNEQKEQINDSFESIPFDKKCASRINNCNDFEIRYLRKNNIENKNSSVIKTAKINMHTSWIIMIMSLVASVCLYFLIPAEKTSLTQKIFYLVGMGIMLTYSLIQMIKFGVSKQRVPEYFYEKNNSSFVILICFILVVITVGLNLIFGLKWNNLISYSGSFILQIINLFLIIISPIIKKILSKFSYYTK